MVELNHRQHLRAGGAGARARHQHHQHRSSSSSSSLLPCCSLGRSGHFILVGALGLILYTFHFASNDNVVSLSDLLLSSSLPNSLTPGMLEEAKTKNSEVSTRILYKPRPFQTKTYANENAPADKEAFKEAWTPVARPTLDGFITRHESVVGDPLRDENWDASTAKPLPFSPKTEYLGVLVDAGRHYFPVPWLYNLMDRLADMKYNLIHFRLTDDQAWNVLLEHTPSLAYPSQIDNPNGRVYTVPEIRALVAYGKFRNISFMPEVNVPGHGGAWAAALNGTAVVQCPRFICEKGYGVPINVTHPDIFPFLETVIREVIDIFDNPPFLHLGGDEVNMARECFHEVNQNEPDYQVFEQGLAKVMEKIGYPLDRIVRWEMSGQAALQRVGKMQHYWMGFPGGNSRDDTSANTDTPPVDGYMFSSRLYFDTNGDDDAHNVYFHAMRAFNFHQKPTAIVAATFELSPTFWFDRNILGRLLSVSMAAAQVHIRDNFTFSMYQYHPQGSEVRVNINNKYTEYCNILGLGPTICDTQGGPVIPSTTFKEKWSRGWDVWKKSICHRLTDSFIVPTFRDYRHQSDRTKQMALGYFSENFASVYADSDRPILADELLPERNMTGFVPEFAGVIFDLTMSQPTVAEQLKVILENVIAKVGNLNTVQLRLAGKTGGWFSLQSKDLRGIDDKAFQLGLQVIPEMSVSSDANGYYSFGIVAQCATRFCRQGVPVDISQKTAPLTIFSLIGMLREDFPKSRFLHLGSDERLDSLQCFYYTKNAWDLTLSDFDAYEYRLSRMLELGGNIEPSHILRWENAEHERYPERTGDITQYRSGTDIGKIRKDDGPFFVTIDLLRKSESSAWALYQHTRLLVDTKPMGIMAEVGTVDFEGWEDWEIPQRILAFSMAVSPELPVLESESEFISTFTSICQSKLALKSCTPPAEMSLHQPSSTLRRFLKSSSDAISNLCKQATFPIEHHLLKGKLPFFHYNVTERQRLLNEPSKTLWPQDGTTRRQEKVEAQTLDKDARIPVIKTAHTVVKRTPPVVVS